MKSKGSVRPLSQGVTPGGKSPGGLRGGDQKNFFKFLKKIKIKNFESESKKI